jgi:hypothetical protein
VNKEGWEALIDRSLEKEGKGTSYIPFVKEKI